MHINFFDTKDFGKLKAAAVAVAATMPDEHSLNITIPARMVKNLIAVGDTQTGVAEAPISVQTEQKAPPAEKPATTRFRRTKAESEAGLDVDEAKAFRESGYDDPAAWLKAQSTSAPVELNGTEVPTSESQTLEEQPSMSSVDDAATEPEKPAVGPTEISAAVKKLIANDQKQDVIDYLAELGVERFTLCPQSDFPQIVAHLESLLNQEESLV